MTKEEHHDGSSLSPVYDTIIIGAGPCGLAVAARMCEHTPSAIFTDEEHQRYHWIRKHGRKMSIMKGKSGCVVLPRDGRSTSASCSCPQGPSYRTLVLDASGDQWMANWNRLFKMFDITHLRSPMFFHVDPRDRDGLLSYAYEQERKNELREIGNCVGKETSKYRKKKQLARMSKEGTKGPQARLEIDERDRKDYFAPSSSLFSNHCECIVDRYGLKEGLIKHERVQDIDFGIEPSISDTDEVFTLTTSKQAYHARTVVVAVGAGNAPTIPCHGLCEEFPEGVTHSNQIAQFPAPGVAKKMQSGRRTNILIVGGGLTSAQIADLAVRKGVTKVWNIMRTELKVKPFDINLEWMGKFRNHEKATFWSADSDADRLQHIRTARNGGSITPFFEKILRAHIASGRVALHTHTTLAAYAFNAERSTFSITTDPPIADLPEIDHVYFATGIASDFATLPFFQTMLRKYPLHGHGGFPCLSEDLMWRGTVAAPGSDILRDERSKVDGRFSEARKNRDRQSSETDRSGSDSTSTEFESPVRGSALDKRIPLFVTGKLASLRLGPGAGNLEGARVGAERIAWALQEVLSERFHGNYGDVDCEFHSADNGSDPEVSDETESSLYEERRMYRYCAGIGSRFESLGLDNGENEA